MKPVSPVMPGFSEPYEFVIAEDQPQYVPLPVVLVEGDEHRMISRWEFTDEERAVIAAGGDLLFHQLTFGKPFQPVCFNIITKDTVLFTKPKKELV